ncbi:hypothetical protein B0T20DRAFT_370472, partial [Sordaria brevicollis]
MRSAMESKTNSDPRRLSTLYFTPYFFLSIWLFFFHHAWAQFLDPPPSGPFVRRAHARVTVLGNYVYIDGGEVSQLTGAGSDPSNSTLSIDISKSWSAQTVEIKELRKGDHGPAGLSEETLWNDPTQNAFYIFGGRPPHGVGSEKITKDGIWKFTADGKGGGSWELEMPSNVDLLQTINLTNNAAFASTYGAQSLGFHIGGVTSEDQGPSTRGTPEPYMITYDMNLKQLAVSSLSAAKTPSGSGLWGGRAEYIPRFGPKGLIFLMGGTVLDKASEPDYPLIFYNLTFFNPQTGKWMWQKTSGVIPHPRQSVCIAGVAGPAGTYELFVFGGTDDTMATSYDDLYVLSLPGFVWFQAPERSVESRANAACAVIGNHQMLVVGGQDLSSGLPETYWQIGDRFPQGLGIFNMTALSWVKDYTYHADAQPYKSHQVVEDWYRGNNLSAVPWSSNQVRDMFTANPVVFNTSNSLSESESTTSTSTNNTNKTTLSNKIGLIVGGVVGGIVGMAILLSVVYYFWIRKPTTPAAHMELESSEGTSSLNTKTELSAEPLAMEMQVTPPELSSHVATGELEARNHVYELDVTNRARELDVPTS